jgi:hypothetical protein
LQFRHAGRERSSAYGSPIADLAIVRNAIWIVVAAALGCSGPLDKKRLHGEIHELRALAAETRLLLAVGRYQPYAANQRPALANKVQESRKHLARGVSESALERPCSEARQLAAGLEALVSIAVAPGQLDDLVHRFTQLEQETVP